jgi:MFS family permease
MTHTEQAARPAPPPLYRWGVLFFISMAMFGNYYIYDAVSPIADLLQSQLGYTDSDVGMLNAIYSIPNVVMVLIGGIIIDRIGTRISVIIFAALCLAGAIVTASTGDFGVMVLGRLIFGLGAESLIVAVTTTIGKWFKGKELSFAFGLNLTLARLGTFAALNSPTWGESFYDSWQTPLLVTVVAGVVCVASALIYFGMEKYAKGRYELGQADEPDKVNFKEIFSFGKSFWIIVLLCVTFYSAVFPFQTFAVKYFIHAHGLERGTGGFLNSLLTLFSMILTPLFGLFADYFGKRSNLMIFGAALLIPVYFLLMNMSHSWYLIDLGLFSFEISSLTLPMAIMGIAFSLIPAVMWPAVALIVKEQKLGTAYGLMTMIQNVGLAGFNLLIGWANDYAGAGADNPDGYNLGLWIFSSLGFFGLIFAVLLKRNEAGPGGHGLEKGIRRQEVG